MSEVICHFGKHKGKPLSEIPNGYLRWAVEKITDPRPAPKYCFQEDGVTPLTEDEIEQLTEAMKNFLSAAEDELLNMEQT